MTQQGKGRGRRRTGGAEKAAPAFFSAGSVPAQGGARGTMRAPSLRAPRCGAAAAPVPALRKIRTFPEKAFEKMHFGCILYTCIFFLTLT